MLVIQWRVINTPWVNRYLEAHKFLWVSLVLLMWESLVAVVIVRIKLCLVLIWQLQIKIMELLDRYL